VGSGPAPITGERRSSLPVVRRPPLGVRTRIAGSATTRRGASIPRGTSCQVKPRRRRDRRRSCRRSRSAPGAYRRRAPLDGRDRQDDRARRRSHRAPGWARCVRALPSLECCSPTDAPRAGTARRIRSACAAMPAMPAMPRGIALPWGRPGASLQSGRAHRALVAGAGAVRLAQCGLLVRGSWPAVAARDDGPGLLQRRAARSRCRCRGTALGWPALLRRCPDLHRIRT
jgi:hypothetical protein